MDIQKTKKSAVTKKPVTKKPGVKLATDAETSPYSRTGFLYSGVPSKSKNGKSIKKAQTGTTAKKTTTKPASGNKVKLANSAQTSPYSNTGFLYSGVGVGQKAQTGTAISKKLVNKGANTKNLLNPKKFASRTVVAKSGTKVSKK